MDKLKIDKQVEWYNSKILEKEKDIAILQKYIAENSYMACMKKEINKRENKINALVIEKNHFLKAKENILADQTDRALYIDGLLKARILRT
jgi:hypothetical protein